MRSEISPTARALLTLELVQNRPGITAELLADKLGVTSRAARRYIAILREAGIPIASVSGPAGGYRPGRGLRLPPLMFSPAEALALVMAVLDGHHDIADAADPVGSALAKILRALPEPVAAQANVVRRTTAPVPDRAAARPDPDITVLLVQACADRRRIQLSYRSEAGTELQVLVEPWAVVVRHSRWYLLCRSIPADAVRAYRVDRVHAVDVLQELFTVPADLDPVQALEEHLGMGWQYEVSVVIDAPAGLVRPCLPRTLGRLEQVDDRTCRLVGSTSDPGWYAEQLAQVPASFRIVSGDEIRGAVAGLAQRMLAAATPD